jgi:CHAT domain-containing protein
VVDPARNLASARRLAALYRRLFPRGRVLVGEEATRAAVRRAFPGAGWIHFDAHGVFDAAFPELTRLGLADGAFDLGQAAQWQAAPELANLAGCNTGRWPATADSGRYGLGGLLCRRGVRWAVATRNAVADDVAADFNRAFYQSLARGRSVPGAFAGALGALSRRHPAVEWAAFQLLDGGSR